MDYVRHQGRLAKEWRDVTIQYNVFGYAPSSVLFTIGNTKVLCSVTLQNGVPPFLRGKGIGWLNAEYAMLPTATQERSAREIIQMSRNGRSSEISRFISRVLRSVVDAKVLGEKTIIVDCDVLQADGGTRAACITAASIALFHAQTVWMDAKHITSPFMYDAVAALSVGVLQKYILIDPDYAEDALLDADFTVVLTKSGNVIELQGCAEKQAVEWFLFEAVLTTARQVIADFFSFIVKQNKSDCMFTHMSETNYTPLFSLKNRLKYSSS